MIYENRIRDGLISLRLPAAALGNHEFDFGPVGPLSIPQARHDDPQGALRQRATEADFPPQPLCSHIDSTNGGCASPEDDGAIAARYENRPVVPAATIVAIAERAAVRAEEFNAQDLGVYLETPITQDGNPESALGNLMTDAVLEMGVGDIAIHNVSGGIRANLPAGKLTYGSVFRMFPFENRIVKLGLSGLDLRRIIEHQVQNAGGRAGFSGMRVFVECAGEQMSVTMLLPDGREIEDKDRLTVIANDFIALGGDGVLTPVMPEGGFSIQTNTPLVRDALAGWFEARGGAPASRAVSRSDQAPLEPAGLYSVRLRPLSVA